MDEYDGLSRSKWELYRNADGERSTNHCARISGKFSVSSPSRKRARSKKGA